MLTLVSDITAARQVCDAHHTRDLLLDQVKVCRKRNENNPAVRATKWIRRKGLTVLEVGETIQQRLTKGNNVIEGVQ